MFHLTHCKRNDSEPTSPQPFCDSFKLHSGFIGTIGGLPNVFIVGSPQSHWLLQLFARGR